MLKPIKKVLTLSSMFFLVFVSGCYLDNPDPVVPASEVIYPLGGISFASAFYQDPDDPVEWKEYPIGVFLNRGAIEAELALPKYAQFVEANEKQADSIPLGAYPELERLYTSVPIRRASTGYLLGESSVMFTMIDDSDEYFVQVQMRGDDGSDSFAFGKAMRRDNRLYVSMPSAADLPRSVFDEFECSGTSFNIYECAKLETYDDFLTAISRSRKPYNIYLDLE